MINNIVKIINEIKMAGTPKAKKEVMMKYKEDELLKKIIYYTYNPYMKYGITKKMFAKYEPNSEPLPSDSLYGLLDELAASNINDSLRYRFVNFLEIFPENIKTIMKGIAVKDLELGVSATTFNKVWPKLIPSFELQLAAKFDINLLDPSEHIFVTEKFDGIRCVCIINNGFVKFSTRQGKDIKGLIDITNDIEKLGFDNMVLDGELVFNGDAKDSGDRYNKTTKIVNSKMENKQNITFHIFDILSIDEFKAGESIDTYRYRREKLEEIFDTDVIKKAPLLYTGKDHSKVAEILKDMIAQKREGCMVNRDHVYQCKRTKSLLKVKKMNDADLRVVGCEEGRGENEGKLGAFIVDYKGYKVNVGSGYSKLQREEFWKNKDMFIGQIIKVQFFEETSNQNGTVSLRFPVFLELRTDKTEPSYD